MGFFQRIPETPETVEARQIPVESQAVDIFQELASWCRGWYAHPDVHPLTFSMPGEHQGRPFVALETPEGTKRAYPGDWIIKGSNGASYVCRSSLFEMTYMPVADPTQTAAGVSWYGLTASAYRAYIASIGNENDQGLPMPNFVALPVATQTAWEAAIRHAVNCFDTGRIVAEKEQSWHDWVSPFHTPEAE